MNVPLLDLGLQVQALRREILEAVTEVIDSTRYILGPEVDALEKAVAQYCGTDWGVGVSSGTDALVMSLMAMDVGQGDTVITTPYTFFATMGAILRRGARPLFVDIEEESFNMDPAALALALEELRSRGEAAACIIPVHLFGQCADMDEILRVAEEHGIPVLEDAAQAIGAVCPLSDGNGGVQWKRAGSMGLAGCFSFFPSKNLGGIGDGGMVTTSDETFVEILRSCRNHGASPKYYHSRVGGNFRLDPIQAVVLRIKLAHLESWHRGRRANSERYRQLFTEAGLAGDPVVLPVERYAGLAGADERTIHIYNQFVIRVPQRDTLREYLQEQGIGCEIYYPRCLHQQECVREYNHLAFPVAQKAAAETLALPIYPELRDEQLAFVVETIRRFYAGS